MKKDKNRTEGLSLTEVSWKATKLVAGKLYPTAINFFFIGIAVFALAIWLPETLWVSVPLVLLPFFFALQMSDASYKGRAPLSNRLYFHFYSAYFKMPFFGVYRVFTSFLKAFLVFVLTGVFAAVAYYAVATSVSPAFVAALSALSDELNSADPVSVATFVSGNSYLLCYVDTVSLIEFGAGFYFFIHEIAINSFGVYLRRPGLVGSPAYFSAILVGTLHKIRGGLLREYWRALWLGDVLLFVGYVGGVLTGLIFTSNAVVLAVCGLAGAFVLIAFYLPYAINVIAQQSFYYRKDFTSYSIVLAQRTLEQLNEDSRLTKEQEEAMKKSLEEAKQRAEDEKSREDSENPTEAKNPDGSDEKKSDDEPKDGTGPDDPPKS